MRKQKKKKGKGQINQTNDRTLSCGDTSRRQGVEYTWKGLVILKAKAREGKGKEKKEGQECWETISSATHRPVLLPSRAVDVMALRCLCRFGGTFSPAHSPRKRLVRSVTRQGLSTRLQPFARSGVVWFAINRTRVHKPLASYWPLTLEVFGVVVAKVPERRARKGGKLQQAVPLDDDVDEDDSSIGDVGDLLGG